MPEWLPRSALRACADAAGAYALEAGRGLELVRACADDWGWHPLSQGGDRGKYVWCDLGAA